MRLISILALTSALVAPAAAFAADAAPTADEIVVTARKREESLKDVPIAVTALAGDDLRDRQVLAVKDIAAYAPGLNINSDSVGRAFVSIRGVGTTLIDTVQPGVGIFIDGVYQPNTSYLNSPLVDVARVEVLRGPQGTLFGNNTLGGAINVITRAPTNSFEGRLSGAYAGTDNYQSLSGSVSGPIVADKLTARIGAAFHKHDGFTYNTIAKADQNPLEQSSVGGTLRFTPADWATFTLNANYDRTKGGNVGYLGVTGPHDYRLTGGSQVANRADIKYTGLNLTGAFEAPQIASTITVVAAYNHRDASNVGDGDFGPVDFIRSVGSSDLTTSTGEIRFDTRWNDNVSSLVGVFASRSTADNRGANTIVPFALTVPSASTSANDSQAVFGTVFVKFDDSLDLAVGLRYDHQRLIASNAAAVYEAEEVQPRVTLTKKWSQDLMTYGSIAKGVRGGGANGAGAPNVIYKGDSVWTYELGTKFSAFDGRLNASAAVFYNDYSDFIGQNSLAPCVPGQCVGFVAVNLNTGHVESYGAEFEGHLRLTDRWRVNGGLTLLHARIDDDSQYFKTIGVHVSSDRIIFTPDWNFNVDTDYTVPLGADDLVLTAGVVGKGSRMGSSLDPTVAPELEAYYLVNASAAWHHDGLEVALFGTNIFNEKYIESYIDQSVMVKAGLGPPIAQNLALQGDRRRYGIRASFKF